MRKRFAPTFFSVCLSALILVFTLFFGPADIVIWGPGRTMAASDDINPGYRSLVTRLPSSHIRLDVAVWYPTRRAASSVKAGDWTFQAARNAPPLPGPWPLLVLSHDSSGSRFAHHDLATQLTSMGYIVAAPTHDGDNAEDMRLLFSDLQLPMRAIQLKATLDLVLNDPALGPHVDQNRIGLVGFGRGGTAGLLLAGATLSPDLWGGYCDHQNGLDQKSPYCEPFMVKKMTALVQSMRDRETRSQEAVIMHKTAEDSRSLALHRERDGVSKAYARIQRSQKKGTVDFPSPPVFLPLLPPLRPQNTLTDPRYKTMAFISPGFSMLFDRASLKAINLPILLGAVDRDNLDKPEQQALQFRSLLAPPTPDYVELLGTDVPALQALCPPEMAHDLPDLCASVTPEERVTIHNQLKSILLNFFRRVWH